MDKRRSYVQGDFSADEFRARREQLFEMMAGETTAVDGVEGLTTGVPLELDEVEKQVGVALGEKE
jgi:hypothetical protein